MPTKLHIRKNQSVYLDDLWFKEGRWFIENQILHFEGIDSGNHLREVWCSSFLIINDSGKPTSFFQTFTDPKS